MPVTRYEEVQTRQLTANPNPHPNLTLTPNSDPLPPPPPSPSPLTFHPHPHPNPVQVDNLAANLKLKQAMWQGLHDWGEQVEGWSTAPFESLNTEAMQQSVNKYNKVCSQVEKGLPINSVIPLLKDKVDIFKALVPVVVALRNEVTRTPTPTQTLTPPLT